MKVQFLPQVRKTIQRNGMLNPRDRVLIAVSGGPDSIALLHALLALRPEYDLSLAIAHLDHGLRGESREDARFVRRMAKDLGLVCYFKRADVADFCKRKKFSPEEGAREVRYAFLEKAAKKARASKIALGHTMDDQAETVLMRLVRGSGPKGLEGIPPVRGKIIRPLIGVRRNEISKFLGQNKLSYLTDPTNRDPRFLRNRIRLRLIPFLEKGYNPRITETLARTGQLLASEQVKKESDKPGWGDAIRARREGKTTKIVLDLSKVLRYNEMFRREAIREALRRIRGDLKQVGFAHVDAVLALMKERVGGEAALPGRFKARRGYDEVIFEKDLPEDRQKPFALPVQVPGVTKLPGGKLKTVLLPPSKAPKAWRKSEGRVAWFDAQRIHFPLTVRTRREGDRFWPLGLSGTKRLKEVLINDKVPREERDRLPLLVDQRGILWIAGNRISERAKVLPETRRILKAEFVPRKKSDG